VTQFPTQSYISWQFSMFGRTEAPQKDALNNRPTHETKVSTAAQGITD